MANDMPGLLAQLRTLLLDTTVTYLWPDATLQQAITEAVTEHSFMYPRLAYTTYDVAANQVEFILGPASGSGISPNPAIVATIDLISVVGVESPVGTPIPEDPWQSGEPAPSHSSRATQGYRWRKDRLRLRRAPSGGEIGTATLAVEVAQTWTLPDAGVTWDGPTSDLPLVYLLAKRSAYQMLAEWQARTQGTAAATIASGNSNVHLDVNPILISLEAQIKRAIDLRAARSGTFPMLPASL